MKQLTIISLAALALLAGCATHADDAEARPSMRLGVFDSRAVAIAWAGSDAFEASLRAKTASHADAERRGDTTRAAAIEAEMQDLQAELHKQGFGVWPVRDILAHVEEEDLAAMAKDAGVVAVVCRWDVVHHGPAVELVDVTDALVEHFAPDAKTRKSAREIRERDPVPLERLREHRH